MFSTREQANDQVCSDLRGEPDSADYYVSARISHRSTESRSRTWSPLIITTNRSEPLSHARSKVCRSSQGLYPEFNLALPDKITLKSILQHSVTRPLSEKVPNQAFHYASSTLKQRQRYQVDHFNRGAPDGEDLTSPSHDLFVGSVVSKHHGYSRFKNGYISEVRHENFCLASQVSRGHALLVTASAEMNNVKTLAFANHKKGQIFRSLRGEPDGRDFSFSAKDGCRSTVFVPDKSLGQKTALSHAQSCDRTAVKDSTRLTSHAQEPETIYWAQAYGFSSRLCKYPNKDIEESGGDDFLGSGSFGDVRKFHHRSLGMVAVKRFTITGSKESISKRQDMVQREANVLCRFNHSNIVQILGITQWTNGVGIVLEYVDGENLHELLARDKDLDLQWCTRLRITQEIVSALSYIHNYKKKKTFCHGDLKPENVLLTAQMHVKLADFGSASLILATGASCTTLDLAPTKQQTLIYVAPEFLENPQLIRNPAMDMYSFGLVLYELISEKTPYFDCAIPTHLLSLIVIGKRPNVQWIEEVESQLWSDSDQEMFNLLRDLMEVCWKAEPQHRPNSKTVEAEVIRLVKKIEQS